MKLRYLICLIFNKRMVDNFNKVSNIKYLLAINFNNTVYYTNAPVNLKFAKPDSKLKPLNNTIKQISSILILYYIYIRKYNSPKVSCRRIRELSSISASLLRDAALRSRSRPKRPALPMICIFAPSSE